MAGKIEQKLVVTSANTETDRDITAKVDDLLKEGWSIQSIAAASLGGSYTQLGIVLVLARGENLPTSGSLPHPQGW